MSEGQGWIIIALMVMIFLMLVVAVVSLDDIHTTLRLMDVACY